MFLFNTKYTVVPDFGFAYLFLQLQILDLAVSFAKVADVDRNLGDEDVAVDEFEEGIKLLESLTLKSEESALEQRVRFSPAWLHWVNSLDPEELI